MPDPQLTRRYRVTGRVQGVGFRYFTRREAARIGVTGWVRNRPDRSVEAVAQGAPERLTEFEGELHRGPRWSKVSGVDSKDESSMHEDFSSFEIRRDG